MVDDRLTHAVRQAGGLGDQRIRRLRRQVGMAFDGGVELVDVRLVVFGVVDFHRLGVDVRLQRVVRVRQTGESRSHLRYSFLQGARKRAQLVSRCSARPVRGLRARPCARRNRPAGPRSCGRVGSDRAVSKEPVTRLTRSNSGQRADAIAPRLSDASRSRVVGRRMPPHDPAAIERLNCRRSVEGGTV